VLIGGFLYYVISNDRQGGEVMLSDDEFARMLEWVERLDLLYSDETYAKLGDLFEEVEEGLERFVNHMYENNLFESLTQVAIEFPLSEREALLERGRSVREWDRLVVLNGEIVVETSSDDLVVFFDNHYELLNIIKDLNESGVILRVTIPCEEDRGTRIAFAINSEHTEFTERLVPRTQNTFIYIRGYELVRSIAEDDNIRNITGNWYMRIMQPFKLGDYPTPLAD